MPRAFIGTLMKTITLKNKTDEGQPLEAIFLPELGMNLSSYKLGDIEVIDQSTRGQFEERFAGLGALIGPHFHRRKREILPVIKEEGLFPHIARVKAKGIDDPFSHGISRYAPWHVKVESETKMTAELSGKDIWNGVTLSSLEGQNFKMTYAVELMPDGLNINLSIVSDTDSLVGIHYYYHLPEGEGEVVSRVQNFMLDQGARKPIPQDWNFNEQQELVLPLNQSYDSTFYPFPNPLSGRISLDTSTYRLMTEYGCNSQENSWQLYHPAEASFVCIEPLSSQDPRHPNLTVSSLQIRLQIIPKGAF